jgi:transcriptional regulator with XRE-family HTH domain
MWSGMKLARYMKLNKLTDEKLGVIVNKDRSTVSRYRRGEVIPPLEVIAILDRETDRAVSFRDFVKEEGAAA